VQANPRRVAKVTKLIEREIGSLMQTDNLLMEITKPKSTSGDVRGTLCSCTGVHVTSDLQLVKVYVSVFTEDDVAKQHTLARLTGLSGCAYLCRAGAQPY
jgi:ribosome-binding factor A